MKRMTTLTAAALFLLAGCTAPGGGGGEGTDTPADGTDPVPAYAPGTDPGVDADVADLTAARNRAFECLEDDTRVEEEELFLALEQGYANEPEGAMTFPEFVEAFVQPEQDRAEEICQTTLENASAELTALIARLTTARNRLAACEGQAGVATDETSLDLIMLGYVGQPVLLYASLTEFAEVYVADFEQQVDDACNA